MRSEGTGLGLTLSKRFIELMGGDIRVDSTPGHGSVFSFYIETCEVESGQSFLSDREVIGLAPGQPDFKILIVEDTEFNRQLLVNLMLKIGFQVKSTKNGQETVRGFSQWQPNLIWMDLIMPVMDGNEATKTIRQLPDGNKVKIIATTASGFSSNKADILSHGYNDVIFKPFRESQLFKLLELHLGVKF